LRTKTIDTQGDKVGKGKKTIDVTVQHLLEIFIDKVNTLSDRIDYLELAIECALNLKIKKMKMKMMIIIQLKEKHSVSLA